MNAEIARFLRNKSPHELLVGQKLNQGLSTLPMHPKLLTNLRSEAHLLSCLGILDYIAIKDAQVNANVIAQSNNAQSIAPTTPNAVALSNIETSLTETNEKIMEIRNSDSNKDRDYSFDSRATLH